MWYFVFPTFCVLNMFFEVDTYFNFPLVFHYLNKALFIYLFSYCWTFRLFPFFSIENNAATNIPASVSLCKHARFLWTLPLGRELLGYRVYLFISALLDVSKCLFYNCSVYILTSSTWESHLSTFLPTYGFIRLNFVSIKDTKQYHFVALICLFLITREVGIFSYVCWCTNFFLRMLSHILWSICYWIVCLFLIGLLSLFNLCLLYTFIFFQPFFSLFVRIFVK